MTAEFHHLLSDLCVKDVTVRLRKKIDGGRKGKRSERELVTIFTDRFGEGFSRALGSGNRWGQVKYMPKHARDTLTGDLCCPEDFRWVLESKSGYDDIDLTTTLLVGSKPLDQFLDQVTKDGVRCGRKPMLLWKKTRKPWLAFVRADKLDGYTFESRLLYSGWACVALERLLRLDDGFFRDRPRS